MAKHRVKPNWSCKGSRVFSERDVPTAQNRFIAGLNPAFTSKRIKSSVFKIDLGFEMHRVTAITKEREKVQFPSEFSQIEFNKNDSLLFAVNDQYKKIDLEGVSLASVKASHQAIVKCSLNGYFCHASQKKVAAVAGVSLSTFVKSLKVLKKSGRVIVTHNYKRDKDNQARRIVSYMQLVAFGKFCKQSLDKCLKTVNLLSKSISVGLNSLFNISSNNGEFKASKWEFVRDFADRTGLSVKYLYQPCHDG